ncbi:MAG: riboflavin synthase [Phycisphaerae bacterium]|nr:riboflavin synthase [Phycisphaerae bacterium]
MFTGIIRHIGTVRSCRSTAGGARLTIDLGPLAEHLSPGDSVAVDGICLTAAEINGTDVAFDAVAESLSRSTLGDLKTGSKVNLELAMRADGRFDGHIVQGHVDGIATVANIRKQNEWTIEFRAAREIVDQMVPKGSVTISGVSLTLVDVGNENFSVTLIPTTLGDTTLPSLAIGSKVNIEVDILGKYVSRYLQNLTGGAAGSLTLDKLRQQGFM